MSVRTLARTFTPQAWAISAALVLVLAMAAPVGAQGCRTGQAGQAGEQVWGKR